MRGFWLPLLLALHAPAFPAGPGFAILIEGAKAPAEVSAARDAGLEPAAEGQGPVGDIARIEVDDNGRVASFKTLRWRTYLEIARGARGVRFAGMRSLFGESDWTGAPESWQAVARLGSELRALSPILAEGSPIGFPAAMAGNGLEARAWKFRDHRWLIVVNPDSAQARCGLGAMQRADWRVVFAPRRSLGSPCVAAGGVLVLEEI